MLPEEMAHAGYTWIFGYGKRCVTISAGHHAAEFNQVKLAAVFPHARLKIKDRPRTTFELYGQGNDRKDRG
jgi:hypothetical protein